METRLSGHGAYRTEYHIVWITKYRRRILNPGVKGYLRRLFLKVLNGMPGCEMVECSILEDHIHMIIQLWPRESVGEVVQKLKGGTSKVIRETHPELKEFLWGDSLWADGYFAETIGSLDEEIVKKYVRDQRL